MRSSQDVALIIKSLLAEQNKTVSEMTSCCDLSKNALSSMQSAGYLPRVENLAKIADYLGVSIDFLLGVEKESAPGDEVRSAIIEKVRRLSDSQAEHLLALLETMVE